MTREYCYWTVDKTMIPGSASIEDLCPWEYVIVFKDWDDMRSNIGEIMEQLIAEEQGLG